MSGAMDERRRAALAAGRRRQRRDRIVTFCIDVFLTLLSIGMVLPLVLLVANAF
jgi:multiple sugar transport system permease protein